MIKWSRQNRVRIATWIVSLFFVSLISNVCAHCVLPNTTASHANHQAVEVFADADAGIGHSCCDSKSTQQSSGDSCCSLDKSHSPSIASYVYSDKTVDLISPFTIEISLVWRNPRQTVALIASSLFSHQLLQQRNQLLRI